MEEYEIVSEEHWKATVSQWKRPLSQKSAWHLNLLNFRPSRTRHALWSISQNWLRQSNFLGWVPVIFVPKLKLIRDSWTLLLNQHGRERGKLLEKHVRASMWSNLSSARSNSEEFIAEIGLDWHPKTGKRLRNCSAGEQYPYRHGKLLERKQSGSVFRRADEPLSNRSAPLRVSVAGFVRKHDALGEWGQAAAQ